MGALVINIQTRGKRAGTPSLTFGTIEAPADVDVRVVVVCLDGLEVLAAHDADAPLYDHAARSDARLPYVVRRRAAHALEEAT